MHIIVCFFFYMYYIHVLTESSLYIHSHVELKAMHDVCMLLYSAELPKMSFTPMADEIRQPIASAFSIT